LAHGIPDPSNPDTLQLSLALRARPLAHVTTISQDRSLVSCRGFEHRNVEIPKHFVLGIPDIPMIEIPIGNFLWGFSSMAPITAARPPLMDCPDHLSRFRDF
jgi:hypothetical protein